MATAGSGRIYYSLSQPYDTSTSRRSISVNIDGLGNANIGVNSQDVEAMANGNSAYIKYDGGQDAEPMSFMFTKSIVASGNGIQKAILYLENN